MLIYNYDFQTKEYLGSSEADKDPRASRREGKFVPLIPQYATLVEPLEEKEEEASVFDEDTNTWHYEKDYRSKYYQVDSNFNVLPITSLGEIPEGYYKVTIEMGNDIKENPDNYIIEDGSIRHRTEEEMQYIYEVNLSSMAIIQILYQKEPDEGYQIIDEETALDALDNPYNYTVDNNVFRHKTEEELSNIYEINLETLIIIEKPYQKEPDEGYQIITKEQKEKFENDPDAFEVIDGVFTDITGTEEYKEKHAATVKSKLVEALYSMKAKKAYGGIIINNLLVFETNETAKTNIVSSVAFMGDSDTAEWKFYTIAGEPFFQPVTKTQLLGLANFGRSMINDCFRVEADYNNQLKQATQEDLNNDEWVETFISNAQADMDEVNNHITVQFS